MVPLPGQGSKRRRMWHPSKEEITTWIKQKKRTFAEEQNHNRRISTEEWLQRYLFTDLHEIIFYEFPIIFHEWLSRIVEIKNRFKKDQPTSWNPILINRLNNSSNPISRAVDYWFENILRGYITEFEVDTVKSSECSIAIILQRTKRQVPQLFEIVD